MAIDEKNKETGEKEEYTMTELIKKLNAQFDTEKAEAEKRAINTMEMAAIMDSQAKPLSDEQEKSQSATGIFDSLSAIYGQGDSFDDPASQTEETKFENVEEAMAEDDDDMPDVSKEAEEILSLLTPKEPDLNVPDDFSDLPMLNEAEKAAEEAEAEAAVESANETAEEASDIPTEEPVTLTEEAPAEESIPETNLWGKTAEFATAFPAEENGEQMTEYPVQENGEYAAEYPEQENGEYAAEYPVQENDEQVTEYPVQENGEYAAEYPVQENDEQVTEYPVQENGEYATEYPVQENGEYAAEYPVQENGEYATEYPVQENGEQMTEYPAEEYRESESEPADGTAEQAFVSAEELFRRAYEEKVQNESAGAVGTSDHPAETSDYPAEASDYPAETSDYPAEASDYPAEASDYPAEASDYPAEASDYPADEYAPAYATEPDGQPDLASGSAQAEEEGAFDTLDTTGTYEIDDSFNFETGAYRSMEDSADDALGQTLFDVLENIARDEAYEMAEEVAAIKAHGKGKKKISSEDESSAIAESEEPVSYENTEMMRSFEPSFGIGSEEDDRGETCERRAVDTEIMKTFGLDPRLVEKKEDPRRLIDMNTEVEIEGEEDYDTVSAPVGSIQVTDDTDYSESEPKKEKKPGVRPVPRFEYSDPDQNADIFAAFKKKYSLCKFRLVVTALFAIALFCIENIPAVFEKLGMVNFILADFAVCFLCAFFSIDRILSGFKSIIKGKVDADAFTAVSFIAAVVTTVFALRIDTYSQIRLFNFSFALCVMFSVFAMFIRLKTDIFTFNIASSKKKKLVLSTLNREDSLAERTAFNAFISDSSDVRSVKTVSFVEDFYARKEEYPNAKKCMRFLLPISVLLAGAAFAVSYFALKLSAFESVTNLYIALMICSPLSAFLSFSYSGYLGAIRAYSYNAALVGNLTPDEYENTAVISVPDDVAFPADKVRIRGVKVYENASIEKVLHYASAVYSKLGGPLAVAFKNAALDGDSATNIVIRSLEDFGVDAVVDGRIVVIGQPSYMDAQCYSTNYESGDDLYEGNSNKRILYLALDNRVIAKFYIQYNTTSDFVYIVRHLAEEKICTSIKSADPGIDNDLLAKAKLDPAVYPIKIMKPILPDGETERASAYEGSIVSTGGSKGLAKALITSRKLLHISKTNLAIKIISMAIGAIIMGLVLFTGHVDSIRPFYPALYQLFWMIPMWLVSKIYI